MQATKSITIVTGKHRHANVETPLWMASFRVMLILREHTCTDWQHICSMDRSGHSAKDCSIGSMGRSGHSAKDYRMGSMDRSGHSVKDCRMGSMGRSGLKAQQALSPGQSEAAPWENDLQSGLRPVRAKAMSTVDEAVAPLRLLSLQGEGLCWGTRHPGRRFALPWAEGLLGFQPARCRHNAKRHSASCPPGAGIMPNAIWPQARPVSA